MRLKSYGDIIIDTYPYHKHLNSKILEESKQFEWDKGRQQVGGNISNVIAYKTVDRVITSSNIEIIYDWIISIINEYLPDFNWEIYHGWLARYSKGEYAVSHHHYPFPFSFVYFIHSPKGSSPLIFSHSGKKIKSEEGKVVIFPGNLKHEVPKCKIHGRMTLAGNFYFNL